MDKRCEREDKKLKSLKKSEFRLNKWEPFQRRGH